MTGALLALLVSATAAQLHASSRGVHAQMQAQEAALLEYPPQQRSNALQETYEAAFSNSIFLHRCAGIAVTDLDDIFLATALIAFYRRDVEWVGRVQCLHDALVAKKMADAGHHLKLHGLLVSVRHFDAANVLRRNHKLDVPALPLVTGAISENDISGMGMMAGGSVEHVVLSPPSAGGIQVIAMVHPFCGFSTRALDSILMDPSYEWLLPYLQLVVPRESAWPEAAMRSWNARYPTHPMHAQGVGRAWQPLDTYETPVFHLLHNGELIISATGWKGDGTELQVVRKALLNLER